MRLWWLLAIVLLLVIVLFVPVPRGPYDDCTRDYGALTYRLVIWKRLQVDTVDRESVELYENTCVYWFPDNFKSIDELWKLCH